MMKIDVRFLGLPASETLRNHTVQSILDHLGRFGREITKVVVRITDVNGPKGGVDKRCHIEVRGPRWEATVKSSSDNPKAAVQTAIEKMTQVTRKRLDRQRPLRGRRLMFQPL